MEFTRITSIKDPLFAQMHKLMQEIFPRKKCWTFPVGRTAGRSGYSGVRGCA